MESWNGFCLSVCFPFSLPPCVALFGWRSRDIPPRLSTLCLRKSLQDGHGFSIRQWPVIALGTMPLQSDILLQYIFEFARKLNYSLLQVIYFIFQHILSAKYKLSWFSSWVWLIIKALQYIPKYIFHAMISFQITLWVYYLSFRESIRRF